MNHDILYLRQILTREQSGAALQSGLRGQWRWTLCEQAGPGGGVLWELVQEGAQQGTRVYALGELLSPQARAIAYLHPLVLDEICALNSKLDEAQERLEFVTWSLERLQNRAYKLKQYEHYADLRMFKARVAVLRELLKFPQMPSLSQLNAWQREAAAQELARQAQASEEPEKK